MSNMNIKSINIRSLCKKYKNHIVFNNLWMNITNEKVNLLLAPNGIGKSTLIKCICNFTKYSGKIEKNFEEDRLCPEKYNFPDYIRVKDIFAFLRLDYDYAMELLSRFKVNKDKFARELSKGMSQKIILTFIVSQDVDAYYFDEPLNGLDDESINIFVEEINRLQNNKKLVLISTHNPDYFSRLNPNIINLREYIEKKTII